MAPDSSPQVDDDDAGGLGFQSFRDRSLSRRNLKQYQEQGNVFSDRPASRSRSNHGRSDRHGWFAFRRRSFFVFAGFALFLLCMVSLFLESRMTSVFMKKREKAWSRDAELELGMTLKFVPQRIPRRFIEGNELDRMRSEDHRGVRKPRLALVSDRVLILSCILKNLCDNELSYVLHFSFQCLLPWKTNSCYY